MRKYIPSNGTEGMWFTEKFCCNCIHGKYEHTGDIADKPCEILTISFVCGDVKDPAYPVELQYDEHEKPTCTAFVKWDWNKDDDGNWNDPGPDDLPVIPDPNQTNLFPLFPSEADFVEKKQTEGNRSQINP